SIQIMFRDVAVFAMLGIGVTLVIITGGIDLSLGSMVALTNMLAAWFMVDQGLGMIPAILAVLIFSAQFMAGTRTGTVDPRYVFRWILQNTPFTPVTTETP
ncbi:MAG: hypothetical protein JSV52_08310, partial [Candidatus Zixiibacteriota bacterium]